jgi:hypothetical protein
VSPRLTRIRKRLRSYMREKQIPRAYVGLKLRAYPSLRQSSLDKVAELLARRLSRSKRDEWLECNDERNLSKKFLSLALPEVLCSPQAWVMTWQCALCLQRAMRMAVPRVLLGCWAAGLLYRIHPLREVCREHKVDRCLPWSRPSASVNLLLSWLAHPCSLNLRLSYLSSYESPLSRTAAAGNVLILYSTCSESVLLRRASPRDTKSQRLGAGGVSQRAATVVPPMVARGPLPHMSRSHSSQAVYAHEPTQHPGTAEYLPQCGAAPPAA